MTASGSFNEVENIQWVCRRYLNREIKDHFSDLGGDDWTPDISSIRGRMRAAMTHKDGDSIEITATRLMLYYFLYGQARQLQPETYSIPITSFDQQRKYKPQITLKFNSKPYEGANDYDYIEGEISFRLMDKDANTITKAQIEAYATKIKNKFAVPSLFTWNKGRKMVSYCDWDKGYQLQLLVTTEAEAKRIVEAVLDIQGHTPDWKKLNVGSNSEETEAYPATPGNQTILGKTRQKPKRRPVVDVKFRYATLTIQGYGRGINLVDASYSRANAIERV